MAIDDLQGGVLGGWHVLGQTNAGQPLAPNHEGEDLLSAQPTSFGNLIFPQRITRQECLSALATRIWDLLIVGTSPRAFELFELANFNDLRCALICSKDFTNDADPPALKRERMGQLQLGKTEGGVFLNYLSVRSYHQASGVVCLACHSNDSGNYPSNVSDSNDSDSGDSKVKSPDKTNNAPNELLIKVGAVILEDASPLGLQIRQRGTQDTAESPRGWFSTLRALNPGVFRFVRGTINTTFGNTRFGFSITPRSEARLALQRLLSLSASAPVGGEQPKSIVVPKQDDAIERIAQNSFRDACKGLASRGVALGESIIERCLSRFGAHANRMLLIPDWSTPLTNDVTLGEFCLTAWTELPTSTEELLMRRLGVSPSRFENDLPKLRALFESLQHLDTAR